jgi:protein transport protein SEC61 subunit gamma-like protein
MKIDIQEFLTSANRVLTVSKKPDTPQYMSMARITALGIIILGIMGFLVQLISFLLVGH